MPYQRTSAYAALAVSVLSIAWSAIFVRWAHMPGIASAFYRLLFAALAIWPFLLFSGKRTQLTRPVVRTALLGGIFFAGDVGLYNVAVLHTSAGNATFLGNNAPVFVGLISWALYRKMPARQFWTALAIAFSGALLIVAIDRRSFSPASMGDALAIAASLCFALFLVVTERLRGAGDAAMLVALSASGSAATLFVAAVLFHVSLAIPSLTSLAALFGLALICQVAGYLALTWALGHLPVTTTSITMLAVAPLTALLALAFFGESETRLQVVGDALILLGIATANRSPDIREPVPAIE
jgi:drug/metabolite transporter (DMT)-like permease